jgi:hypothetical protein
VACHTALKRKLCDVWRRRPAGPTETSIRNVVYSTSGLWATAPSAATTEALCSNGQNATTCAPNVRTTLLPESQLCRSHPIFRPLYFPAVLSGGSALGGYALQWREGAVASLPTRFTFLSPPKRYGGSMAVGWASPSAKSRPVRTAEDGTWVHRDLPAVHPLACPLFWLEPPGCTPCPAPPRHSPTVLTALPRHDEQTSCLGHKMCARSACRKPRVSARELCRT